MSDPRKGFKPEAECGIKITQLDKAGPVYLILARFDAGGQIMDFTEVQLDHFMQHGVQPIWMKNDQDAHDLYEQDQRMRDFIFLERQKFEQWYVQQPMVIRLTDGRKTWDYRITFWNWLTCEQEFKKIMAGEYRVAPFEEVVENTAEEPHVIIDPV